MAADLEIYGPTGLLLFRASDYIGRVLGAVGTNGAPGTYYYPKPYDGRTFWASFQSAYASEAIIPIITVTSQYITWAANPAYGGNPPVANGVIIFGCY